MIENVVLVSGIKNSDSVIHYLFFYRFFSCRGYYRILNIEFPVLHSRLLLIIDYIYISVYVKKGYFQCLSSNLFMYHKKGQSGPVYLSTNET